MQLDRVAVLQHVDLKPGGETEREKGREARFEEVVQAVRRHGTASVAARALGVPRSAVVWQLRRAGKTVGDVLG